MTVANIVSEHQGENGFQGSQNDLIKLVIRYCRVQYRNGS